MRARMLRLSILGLALAIVACRPHPEPRAPTIIPVLALEDEATAIVAALAAAPVDDVVLRPAVLAETEAASPASADPDFAAVRRAYIDADFAACRLTLDGADVAVALAAGRRDVAARVLLWRVACRVGDDDGAGARDDVMAFAAAGLELPADVVEVTPEVESLLSDATRVVAGRERATITITTVPAGARVSVDGGAEQCATPCRVALRSGPHVIAVAADGFVDSWRRVVTPEETAVTVELAPASPEIAARQLRLRLARGGAFDEPSTVALAAQAVRAPRLLVLSVRRTAGGNHVRGVLHSDGDVVARAERRGAEPVQLARALASDLLTRSGVVVRPPLWRQRRFWISTAVVAGAAGALGAWLAFRPDPTTGLEFP